MATNLIGSATIRIVPDSAGFSAALQGQLRGVSGAIQNTFGKTNLLSGFNNQLKSMSDNLARTSNRMIGMGEAMTYGLTRPLIGLAKQSVMAAADFDLALRTIAAVSELDVSPGFGKFEGDLGRIEAASRELGRITKFSAIEVAKGFTDLARAGLPVEAQIGAIGEVIKLATVENLELAQASDRLINVYTGFGFSLDDINKKVKLGTAEVGQLQMVTDVLAKVSASTTSSMTTLTDAFRYAGPVAAAAGLSFAETAAALGVLDQAGFKATVGGTALRGIITRLAVPTKVNQENFDKLQLSVEGAVGAMTPEDVETFSKGLSRMGLSGKEINESLGVEAVTSLEGFRAELGRVGISQQELFNEFGDMRDMGEVVAIFADRYKKGMFKVGDAMKLFGQRAGPGFLALLQNEELLQKVTEGSMSASEGIGAAAEQAAKINASASVKFIMMKNALVDLNIAIGQSGVLDFFVDLAGSVGEFAKKMAASNPEMFRYVFLVGGLVAALGPLRIVLGLIGAGLNSFIIKPLILLTSPLGLVVAAVGVLVGVFGLAVSRSQDLRDAFSQLHESARPLFTPILELGKIVVGSVAVGLAKLADILARYLVPQISMFADEIDKFVRNGGIQEIFLWFARLIERGRQLGEQLVSLSQGALRLLVSAFDNLRGTIEVISPLIIGLKDSLLKFAPIMGKVLVEAVVAFLFVWQQLNRVLAPIFRFLGENADALVLVFANLFLLARVQGTAFRVFMANLFLRDIPTIFLNFPRVVGNAMINAGIHILLFGNIIQTLAPKLANLFQHPINSLTRLYIHIQITVMNIGNSLLMLGTRARTAMNSFQMAVGGGLGRVGNLINAFQVNLSTARWNFSFGGVAASFRTFFTITLPTIVRNGVMATGTALSGLGTRLIAFGQSINSRFTPIKADLKKHMQEMQSVTAMAMQGLMGLFSGQMLASATDMKGKIMGMTSAIVGLVIAFASGGPVMAAFVAGMTILGMLIERMSGDTNDLTNATDGYISILGEAGQAQKELAALQLLQQEANKLGKDNFNQLSASLKTLGIPMDDLRDAFLGGEGAMRKFIERFKAVQVATELGNVQIKRFADGTQSAWKKMADGTEKQLGLYGANVDVAGELTKDFKAQVDERLDVKFLEGMATDAGNAAESFAILSPAMKKVKEEQEHLKQETQTVKSAYDAWNQSIQNVINSLYGINNPVEDIQRHVDIFTLAIQGSQATFAEGFHIDLQTENLSKVSTDVIDNLLNPVNEAGAGLRQTMKGFVPDFRDAIVGFASSSPTFEIFEEKVGGLKDKFKEMLIQLGFNEDAAGTLVGKLLEFTLLPDTKKIYLDAEAARTEFANFAATIEAQKLGVKVELYPYMDQALLDKIKGVADASGATPKDLVALASGFKHQGGIIGDPGGETRPPSYQLKPDEEMNILQIGEAVIPKDVVEKLGADTFRDLIAGQIPASLLEVTFALNVSATVSGIEVIVMTFLALAEAMSAAITAVSALLTSSFASATESVVNMLGTLQSTFAIAAINIVSYVTMIASALRAIPSVMTQVATAIASGFRNPISFIGNSVWPPFANMLNSAAGAFGVKANIPVGFTVPVFHEGGLVGKDGQMRAGGPSSGDELLALLQTGEGVMTREMMASMTAAQVDAFRRGNPRWFAVGGPYESGQGHVANNASSVGTSIDSYDLDAMRATYDAEVRPMLARMQALYANNIVSDIGAAAIGDVADGAFDWVSGANAGVQAEMKNRLVAIGLPADFDMNGALPTGFDLDHWRSFLGANKAPGDWPLIASYLQAAGVPYLLNSTLRPGDGGSYHASGRAVDFGAPGDANYDSPGLLKINHALAPLLGVLSELIYSGPGGISDKAYDSATMAAHHNHVHAALAKGGIVNGFLEAILGEAGPEVVLPLSDPGRALDIALASNLFSVLGDAAASRQGQSAPAGSSSLGYVPAGGRPDGLDGGFLGGGPGNTYNITGVDMDHVKTEIRNRDQAVMRKRR